MPMITTYTSLYGLHKYHIREHAITLYSLPGKKPNNWILICYTLWWFRMELSPLLSFEFSKIKFLDPRLSANISKWIVSSLDISQFLCYVNPRGRICGHFILLGQCRDVGISVKDGKKGFKEGIFFFIFFTNSSVKFGKESQYESVFRKNVEPLQTSECWDQSPAFKGTSFQHVWRIYIYQVINQYMYIS